MLVKPRRWTAPAPPEITRSRNGYDTANIPRGMLAEQRRWTAAVMRRRNK
jgi:hypothetical protein